jgi:uncharacterized protein YjeT (DUF2065 family)
MRIKLAWVRGLLSVANGIFMLIAPAPWYAIIPGVSGSGPLNAHFLRDIGAAFIVAGGSLAWFCYDVRARPAAVAAAAFFVLHAVVHLGDTLAGRESLYQAARDLPTIYLSALLTIWIAWPTSTSAKRAMEDEVIAKMAVTPANRRIRAGV